MIIISVVASVRLWNVEQQRVARALEGGGEVLVDSTEDAISNVVARLNAVSGLYESSEKVTRDEFSRFVEKLGLLPGFGGIGYMPIVRAGDLDRFVAQMRETVPDYAVCELDRMGEWIPVGERPEYVPLQWFEPANAFERSHGFDSFSNAERLAALERARSTREVAATPFLELASEQESDGLFLYWPATEPDTKEVVGFAVAVMDVSELLDNRCRRPSRVKSFGTSPTSPTILNLGYEPTVAGSRAWRWGAACGRSPSSRNPPRT